MDNYQTWLERTDVVRMAIVQAQVLVAGTLTTRYMSTHGVIVDGIEYLPIIMGTISISESISTSYSASISYGDLELANNNGEYDTWLGDIWVNKSVKIYIGSLPTDSAVTTLSQFELVFDGLIDDIDSKNRTRLNLKLRDKLEKLNTSVSEALLGNYNPQGLTGYTNVYQNNLKPLCYGEVHNITPLLTEPALLEYMVNLEAVEQITEVRDNGVPVAFTTVGTTLALPAGSFRLLKSPVGTVTCSVQGMKKTPNLASSAVTDTYTNTASNTLASILRLTGQTLAYTEIDSTSFGALGTQPIGLYLNSRVNVLATCQEIAKSCALILTVTRAGKVRLVELDVPTSASTAITEADMVLNTLAVSEKVAVIAGVKLGYAKNWTVQTNLLTAIPQEHKDLYSTEYLESVAIDTTIKNNFSLTTEPEQENTLLITKADADAVALKKLNLFKAQRKVLTMTCTARLLSVQIGDAVTVTSSRFGLGSGALGRVVSTKPNWLKGTIEIGVLV